MTADDRVTETPCSTVGNHTFCCQDCSCACHDWDAIREQQKDRGTR